jgi:hypothetical protein
MRHEFDPSNHLLRVEDFVYIVVVTSMPCRLSAAAITGLTSSSK